MSSPLRAQQRTVSARSPTCILQAVRRRGGCDRHGSARPAVWDRCAVVSMRQLELHLLASQLRTRGSGFTGFTTPKGRQHKVKKKGAAQMSTARIGLPSWTTTGCTSLLSAARANASMMSRSAAP